MSEASNEFFKINDELKNLELTEDNSFRRKILGILRNDALRRKEFDLPIPKENEEMVRSILIK